jgi:hypothetical protein
MNTTTEPTNLDIAREIAARLIFFGQSDTVWSLRDGHLRGPRGLIAEDVLYEVETADLFDVLDVLTAEVLAVIEEADAEALADHAEWLEGA